MITVVSETIHKKDILHFKKKDVIFKEHEEVTGYYTLESGLVRTFKTAKNGKEQTFQIAGSGKWLGLRDLISGDRYNHTAICLADTNVCFISKESMQESIKLDSNFQLDILRHLASESKEIENLLYSLGTKQIHSRLADLLISMYENAGKKSVLKIDYTREVMSSCIGTTPETLNRALGDFKDRNWIILGKNTIEIVNLVALFTLSENSTA